MLRRLAPFAVDLYKHRELLWQFTLRNVELRHKGSHLGLLWSVLNPLLMLGLYVLVFGYIFGGKFGVLPNESRADYAIAIFLGLTVFHFLSEVLGTSPAVIVGNPNFVKKVVFPLEILPAANVLGALFHMFISLGLVLACAIVVGRGVTWEVFWLPVILAPILLWSLGVAWFFGALGVFLRDIGQVMQFLSMALMFASAIFYSTKQIPTAAWEYMRFNPVLLAVELARGAMLWDLPLNLTHLGYLYVTGFGVCYLGYVAFQRMKPAFADVL